MSADAPGSPRRVLIVANRTAATPMLLEEVRRRASEGACRFTLLVPRAYWDADTEESAITLELAIPLLEDVSGGRVEGLIGDQDAFVAASTALQAGAYDSLAVITVTGGRIARSRARQIDRGQRATRGTRNWLRWNSTGVARRCAGGRPGLRAPDEAVGSSRRSRRKG